MPTQQQALSSKFPIRTLLWAAAGLAVLVLLRDHLIDALGFAAANLALISPLIVIGIGLTAYVTASGATGLIAAAFAGRQGRMIVLASLVGAMTPVCGLTVFPLVAGLLAAGVPLAPIMAFWLSSPVTDPAMLTVTAGILGLEFAIGKTLAALCAGLLGGGVTFALTRAGFLRAGLKPRARPVDAGCDTQCAAPSGLTWAIWRDAGRRAQFRDTAISQGRLILLWLGAALIAEYTLRQVLPPNLIAGHLGGDGFWSVPLAAVVGAPLYLDGHAALPLVRGLIDAGLGQGPAMALLVAGGITSAWAAVPVYALVRKPLFALYIALALASAMLAGWGFVLLAV